MTTKIISKFSLPSDEGQSTYAFQGKVEKNGPFVEIDGKDEDILEDVIEIKFQASETATSQQTSSPTHSTASTLCYPDQPSQTTSPSTNASVGSQRIKV